MAGAGGRRDVGDCVEVGAEEVVGVLSSAERELLCVGVLCDCVDGWRVVASALRAADRCGVVVEDALERERARVVGGWLCGWLVTAAQEWRRYTTCEHRGHRLRWRPESSCSDKTHSAPPLRRRFK